MLIYAGLYQPVQRPARTIKDSGRYGILTLEPYTSATAGFDLSGILSGKFDSKIRAWSCAWSGVGAVPFAHEMNGSWYPWGRLEPEVYKTLWNYVRGVWRAEELKRGAAHAPWLWCPNITTNGRDPFDRYFPGHTNAELSGLDGYSYARNTWRTPEALFTKDAHRLQNLSNAPALICETAIEAGGPNRAIWLDELASVAYSSPLRGFIWYDRVLANGADYSLGRLAMYRRHWAKLGNHASRPAR